MAGIAKRFRTGTKRWSMAASAIMFGGIALAACGSPAKTTAQAPKTSKAVQNLAVEVETGKMDGKAGWPRFVPSSLTVKANQPVRLVITSYDDGTAPLPSALVTYDKVAGGTETVGGVALTSVKNSEVSHTFTVPQLGLNAVIPAAPSNGSVKVVFTFTPTKSGTFTWQCYAPCGSGSDGMGGAMVTKGWMTGSLQVS